MSNTHSLPRDYERAAWLLLEDLQDARAERDTYRELLHAALDQLRALTVARERDQRKYLMLLDELRQLRGTERRAA
jgi:hypothetical protein